MRFTITPLGGVQRSLTRIAEDIVDYLIPPSRAAAAGNGGESYAASYYADSGEEPGRWLGRGAQELGLRGDVGGDDFYAVLVGRDPRSGERLIAADGSAGRRPRLGAGSATRWAGGEPIYDERDAAVALGLERGDLRSTTEVGLTRAAAALIGFLAGRGDGHEAASGVVDSYITPIIDADGVRWVSDSELRRYEDGRAIGGSDERIAAAGAPDDLLTLREAAAYVGVTPRYLRDRARNYELRRELIDGLVAAGERPRQAYLVAQRDARGRWQVRRDDLVAFVGRRRAPAVRAGYDVTLTAEKSLSVLALLSQPHHRRQILDTIREANDIALAWLEKHAAGARARGEPVSVTGWTAASFGHLTSRALDPHPHWHNVIANTVQLSDGRRRALDARGLYRHAKAASALATAQARWMITRHVGVRWRQARHGGWEIAGITDDVVDGFSQRHNEVDDAVRRFEDALGRGLHPDEVDDIVLRTRTAKQWAQFDELTNQWWERAKQLGMSEADLAACMGDRRIVEPDPAWLYARLAQPDGICLNRSVFDDGDVLAALVDAAVPYPDGAVQPLLVCAERLEELAQGFVRSRHVVRLMDGDQPLYTTREILAVQERVAARFAAGRYRNAAVLDTPTIDAALDAHTRLTGEQRQLVRHLCGSGDRIACGIGHAGTGKTTAMGIARQAWEAAGYRVFGAAVKGEAARRLHEVSGIQTETLSWLLAHQDPHTAPVDARTVLVVDEASTISDRDLDRVGWLCDQTGATLRLVGDPDQHGAVEAGGMFRVLCERHRTPRLTQSQRVRNAGDRAAADALRRGDVDEALDYLVAGDHLHILDDEDFFYRRMITRWWSAHQDGLNHPMVDRGNIVRRRLNRLAHRVLQAAGQVGAEETCSAGERHFAAGDRVIARAPARDLHPPDQPGDYVRNGAIGTITDLYRGNDPDKDAMVVAFDEIGPVTLPRSFFDEHEVSPGRVDVGLDHAYAVTSWAVQGSTAPTSTSRIDEHSTRAEALVDITRGTDSNVVFLARSTAADELAVEHLPRAPRPTIDHAVSQRLRASTGEITAYELLHQPHQPATPQAAAVSL